MRGRKPKPVELHRLTGSYRADRHGGRMARQPGEIPDKPAWLPPEASAEWDRIAPTLAPLGLLTPLDRAAFVAYCLAWAEFVWAVKEVQQAGITYEAEGKLKPHPAVRIASNAAKLMLQLAGEFGMTPAARTRLRIELAEFEEDPFEEFLQN